MTYTPPEFKTPEAHARRADRRALWIAAACVVGLFVAIGVIA